MYRIVFTTPDPDADIKRALRRRLLASREAAPAGEADAARLAAALAEVLLRLEPQCLGVYWPMRGEFNPALLKAGHGTFEALPRALPYCRREPREMHDRAWNGAPPPVQDECRIPASDGAPVVPDVVLAPCVGYTPDGRRLGYGGGYFDRWLAAHPHATAIGVAWSGGALAADELPFEPHDRPLMLVVTEHGVVD